MKEEFAGWFSDLSFHDDAEYINKRWEAVNSLVESATKETLELLARIVFRVKVQMTAPDVAQLRAKLTGSLTPPGDEELIRLSAAALAWSMHEDDDNCALSATLVSTASCGGLRAMTLPMDLIGISENLMRQVAETSRRRPSLEIPKLLSSSLDKNEVATAVAQAEAGELGAALQGLANSTNKLLGALARRQMTIESTFQQYVNAQDEELDILWWLQGGHCGDLGEDFADIPAEQRPLAIARELAKLTTILPGPPALPSLLARAIANDAPANTIPAAVQGMPAEWVRSTLEGISPDRISQYTTPIIFAFVRCQELDGESAWISAWATLTGLDATAELEPLRIAEAAYREFVLVELG